MIVVERKEEKEVEEFKMVDFTLKNNRGIFSFKNTHNSIVNAFRRIILTEVPTFAIDEVEVVKNDSPLYDETVAQRIGLVPLKTDLQSYNFKKDCKCGGVGCAMCEVKMSLKQEEPGYVYSGSIVSDDPVIVPFDEKIPITKLFNSKKIELNLRAILGCGKDHSKWSPAHSYIRESEDKIDLIVEPFGQLEVKEIFNKSIDILIEKIDSLEASL